MIRSLELNYFRKHEHLVLSFEPGTVVLRGHNEAGKSTIFQAIAYALFGARALPQALDEVVTHGHPASALRVGLVLELGGARYDVARSARGAEVKHPDGLVTGQTECSAFIEKLVGAPAALATNLFFANQNSIRGALGSGSKATSSLIETLADFGQIDQLIELIQSSLTTGQTKPFEERLAQAEATLESIGEPQPPKDLTKEIQEAALNVLSAEAQYDEILQAREKHTKEVLEPLRARKAERDKLSAELVRLQTEREVVEARLQTAAVPEYDEQAHEEARRALAEAEKQDLTLKAWANAHAAFAALPIVKSVWEGDGPSFVAFCEKNEADLIKLRDWISKGQAELAGLNRQVLEGICKVCGLDYDTVPSVGDQNVRVRAERDALVTKINETQAALKEKEVERAAVKLITQQWQLYRDFIARYGSYVSVDTNFVPPKVEFTAPEPQRVDVTAVKRQVAALERAKTERAATLGRIQEMEALLERNLVQLQRVMGEMATMHSVPLELGEAESTSEQQNKLCNASAAYCTEVASALSRLKNEAEQGKAVYAERLKTYELAREQAAAARQQLQDVSFNNALLKKVRTARPIIVDRLWSVLLAAVGHYFSQMRGTSSTVTRTDGVFLVDGRPVEGLSGSTLDILGLAIRVALLKTFLPACSLLVLDEPAAACDDDREASLLGTIVAAQFEQILIVTHSDLADAYADQLVQL